MEEKPKKTRRSYVDKMFDSISDMKDSDREELIERLLDLKLDETPAKEIESEGCSLIPEYYEAIEERDAHIGKMVGLGSGITVVDDMTMGLAPGELIIVAAQTSVGKTKLCLNIAANLAISGHKVGFITMEMTKPEIGARLKQIMGWDNYEKMENIIVNKSDKMAWQSVDMFVEKSVEKDKIEILFIDHLHYFSRSMDNTAEELGLITQEFKHIAIKYGIPVVLISHTRKTDNNGTERKATMNDLRGSSFIAQDADIVLMLNRVTEGGLDGKSTIRNDVVEITLEKNRNRFKVPIGTSYNIWGDGMRFWGRMDDEHQKEWEGKIPKSPNKGFSTHYDIDQTVESTHEPQSRTPSQTASEPQENASAPKDGTLFDQSDLI